MQGMRRTGRGDAFKLLEESHAALRCNEKHICSTALHFTSECIYGAKARAVIESGLEQSLPEEAS